MSDIFDFEELMSDILGVTDEQREDDDFIRDAFAEKFEFEFEQGYELVLHLISKTPVWEGALTKKQYQGFVDPKKGVVLMKQEFISSKSTE